VELDLLSFRVVYLEGSCVSEGLLMSICKGEFTRQRSPDWDVHGLVSWVCLLPRPLLYWARGADKDARSIHTENKGIMMRRRTKDGPSGWPFDDGY
jgi:hypothetical protein